MKYLGLVSKNKVDTIYMNNKVDNLFGYTSNKLLIRIGYQYIDNLWVAKYMAIQMDNSATSETFEIFEICDIPATSEKEMRDVICQIADEVVKYNIEIIQYYSRNCQY